MYLRAYTLIYVSRVGNWSGAAIEEDSCLFFVFFCYSSSASYINFFKGSSIEEWNKITSCLTRIPSFTYSEPKLCWKFGLREFKMLLLFYISMFFSLPSSSVRGCVLELEELSLEEFSSLFSYRPRWKWMSWASSFAGEFTRREQATGGECGGYSTNIARREEESEDGT